MAVTCIPILYGNHMKKLIILLSFSCLLLACGLQQSRVPQEHDIHRVVSELTEAWENKDAKRWAKHFAEDADWIVWFGQTFSGRDTVAAVMDFIWNDFYADTHAVIEVAKIRFIEDNVAVVHLNFSIVDAKGDLPSRPTTVPVMVMQNNGSEWEILMFQSTRNLIEERSKNGDARL